MVTSIPVPLNGTSGTRFTSCCLRVMGQVVVIRLPATSGWIGRRWPSVRVPGCAAAWVRTATRSQQSLAASVGGVPSSRPDGQ